MLAEAWLWEMGLSCVVAWATTLKQAAQAPYSGDQNPGITRRVPLAMLFQEGRSKLNRGLTFRCRTDPLTMSKIPRRLRLALLAA